MWYESVKMFVRPSVRPKEWMEKRTRLIDRVWKCVSTSIIYWRFISPVSWTRTVSVRPSVHAKAKWTRTGIWKCDAFFWLSLISSTQKGENLFWGKSKVLTHLKVSENKTTSSDFLRRHECSEKLEWYERICDNKFSTCRQNGHFRIWPYDGISVKCSFCRP